MSYTDPNGESFILAAAIIGGWIGMGAAMVSSGLVGSSFMFGSDQIFFNHDLMEFHAYSFQHSLGGTQLSSFSPNLVKAMVKQWLVYFNKLGAANFGWTKNLKFKYPF